MCALSLTSIFSIGFASWTFTTPSVTPVEILGGVKTDYVIYADNYLSFDNPDTQTDGDGVILPAYNQDGFVVATEENGKTIYTNSSTASITIHLIVDYDNCQNLKALGETTMDISVAFTLGTTPSAFFNDTLAEIRTLDASGIGSSMPWITKNSAVIGEKTVAIGYTVLIENYDFSALTEDGKIKLTILFDSTGNEEEVYDCLNGNTFVFNTCVHSK